MRLPRIPSLVILAAWSASPDCGAWGSGHDPMNRLGAELLAPPIAEFLGVEGKKSLVARAHAPDDFTPWTDYAEKKGVMLPEKDLAFLARHGIKNPYGLHSAKGQAVNVLLVAQAFQDRADPAITGFWMACLLHTLCDEAACNHDPLIHYLTYGYRAYGLHLSAQGFLDVGELCRTAEGMAMVRTLIREIRPTLGSVPPGRLLAETMMDGYHANAYMTARGVRVARAFAADLTPAELADSRRALAELGAYGVASALRLFDAAWQAAETRSIPVLDKAVLAGCRKEKSAFLADRPLSADALYAEWLPLASRAPGAIGVVVEPSQRMADRALSWGGKLISAAMMRNLHQRGQAFRPVDLRELESACPAVEEMPIMVVCTGAFQSKSAIRNLKSYREKGGRLLLIGGEHRGCLGPLSEALVKADPEMLPVSLKYGRHNEKVISRIRVRFTGPLEIALGPEPYRFVHNPDTPAGWQKPACPYCLSATLPAGVVPLARLEIDGRVIPVAAVWKDADGRARAVFLPEYLLAPYLLADAPSRIDPSRPALDPVGTKIFESALALLR